MGQIEYFLKRISNFNHEVFSFLKDFLGNGFFISVISAVRSFISKKVLPGKIYEFFIKLEIRVSGLGKRVIKFIYDVLRK